ncbi:MAG: 4-hydroxy-3-methylbut-2-enyl diphosphate reductase [Candidatus Adiutrix sp.]|jgi:4-hydroxy-3-methylbut-2-enyl diphosphate reductase|nr:4-hydroxy-3-methylbut-2-enyl diphosphate reductase [Candidatus Adiutrix sp.]
MKIKLARTLGYCLGVRRAMNAAFRQLSRRSGAVYSHGELIHNAPALALLSQKGLALWNGETEGTVIIRAHGLPPKDMEFLAQSKLTVSDATCPRVRQVQLLAQREAAGGRLVIIWGKADHPEVVGILGHAAGRGRVAANPEDVAALPDADRVLLISQTTQDLAAWPAMEAAVLRRWPEAMIRNTICEATEERQAEVRRLAGEVQALVVVGGKTSGNTARLADIGRRAGLKTILVETVEDLIPEDFEGLDSVGVAAGASTSAWQISQVVQALSALARARGDTGGFWARLLRALILSSLYAALGLASLALAVGVLMGQSPPRVLFSFFFFQVTALHLFRDFFQGRGPTLRFNDPDRTAFFDKYRRSLQCFTVITGLLAAAAAWLAGPGAMAAAGAAWLAGLIYKYMPRPRYYSSLGLPRTLLGPMVLGAGWGLVMVAATVWSEAPFPNPFPWGTAVWAGGAAFWPVFTLAVMGDVLGAQGDRFFGRPTLPTVFGEKAARQFLRGVLGLWALWLAAGALSAALPSLAWGLMLCGPVYSLFLLKPLFRNAGLHGFRFEAVMFGQLILTGLAVLLWTW